MPRRKKAHSQPPEEVPIPAKLWGLKEVSEYLQVKRTLLHDLMKKEGLPYIPMGSKRFFYPPSVAAWMLNREQTG